LEDATPLPPRPRWREDGLFEAVAVAPAPVPIPMPPPPVATLPTLGTPVFQGPAAAVAATSTPVSVPVFRRPSSTLASRARRNRSALPMLIIFASLFMLIGAAAIALVLANRPAESAVPPDSASATP
jgi:hypothetical protein